MRHTLIGSLILGSVLFGLAIARAAEQPDGTVKLTSTSVAAGVGISWGNGVLTYKGKAYPFTISGVSAGNIGLASAEITGEVYNLKNLEDFNGTFATLSAGLTVAGGGQAAAMRNQNGVVLNLVGTTQGLDFKFGVDGVKIELVK